MLQELTDYSDSNNLGASSVPGGSDLSRIVSAAIRQYKKVVFFALVGLAIGIAYSLTASPRYTARAEVLIDSQRLGASGELNPYTGLMFDTSAIDSQVEVFKSDRIAYAVIQKLKLDQDPEFTEQGWSLLTPVFQGLGYGLGLIFGSGTDLETLPADLRKYVAVRNAVEQMAVDMDVRRIGRTYVITVDYTARNPAKAAQIANAIAEVYIADQLDSKFDATKRASSWLEDRIQSLKQKSLQSDLAVQRFRADNNLTATNGNLLSDQQLNDANAQLILARAETTRLEARYNRLQEIVSTRQTDAALSDSIGSPVITELRVRYLKASKMQADIISRFGANHEQALNLGKEMAEYERQIFGELGRLAESARSEFDIAKAREGSIEKGLADLVSSSASKNETMVALRQLEQEAENYRTLYQSFMARYQESVQKQSFPVTEARVITPASTPLQPSRPRKLLIMLGMLFAGASVGGALGFLSEMRDRAFRTGDQMSSDLGLEFIGMTELLPIRKSEISRAKRRAVPLGQVVPVPTMQYAVKANMSAFAETLRGTRLAIDIATAERSCKVIGVISVLPGEGKTTIIKNLASHIAHQGSRVLLIDGDIRHPNLSRTIAPKATAGLIEVLLGTSPVEPLLLTEAESGLSILPIAGSSRVTHSSQLISSMAMKAMLKSLSERFDYIFIDLPPMAPLVDVKAMADLLDGVVLVVEWGRTARAMVRRTLETDPKIYRKCVGTILNKVNLKKMRLYDDAAPTAYYSKAYEKYYQDAA